MKMAGQCALEDPVGKLTVAALKACFAALDRVAVVQRTPPTGNKNDLKALLQERRLAEHTRRRLALDASLEQAEEQARAADMLGVRDATAAQEVDGDEAEEEDTPHQLDRTQKIRRARVARSESIGV